jgi:hypothetical protein
MLIESALEFVWYQKCNDATKKQIKEHRQKPLEKLNAIGALPKKRYNLFGSDK